MYNYLNSIKESTQQELYMGDIIQAAITEGLRVEGLQVSSKPLLDIGTGDDLLRAVKYLVHLTELRE